jgi:glutathione reductase (NADPH)
MSDFDYDLFVIGAGSGGVRAARMSAGYGAKVAVAEEYRVGGTCVIRGCVPKKLFVYASRFGGEFEDSVGFGWRIEGAKFDWKTLVTNKDKEIDRLNGIYVRNLQASGVDLIMDRAEVTGPNSIRLVEEGREVTARYILIAAGGWPFLPELPGIEHAITSNEAFHLDELPESIAVVGAGYIAVEFAGIFAGLGVDVSLLYRGDQILRGFDDDLRDGLAKAMRARGIDVRVNTDVAAIEKTGKGYRLALKNGDMLDAGLVMYATGRNPNTDGLGLEKAGVELGWNGHVVVDEYSKSSVDNIYAVGDVADRVALTPVAIREGAAVAETLFNNNPTPVDHDFIPTAVFSEPEIGTVGLTEAQAREMMIMKLLVDAESDTVVGCHILGPDAGEMAQILAIPMRMGATKADFDATMALHPSAAEELVTMREKWRPPEAEAAE